MGCGDAYPQQDYRSEMLIKGERVRLRALEPADIEVVYHWENDPAIWRVSGTMAPLSRERIARFIEEQSYDIYATRGMRLVIEVEGIAVGSVDCFDFEPRDGRMGIGIMVYAEADRRKGYAHEAIELIKDYARTTLALHQIWASVADDNAPSKALFEGCGFVECGRRREWLWRAEGYADEVEYQCIL